MVIIAHVQHAFQTMWMVSSLIELIQISELDAWKSATLEKDMDKCYTGDHCHDPCHNLTRLLQ